MAKKTRRRGVLVDGKRLCAARERRGLTQASVAEKVGLSEESVRRAEKGGPIDQATLNKLAAFCGETPDDLLAPDIRNEKDARKWLAQANVCDARMDYGRAIEIARVVIDRLGEASRARAQACVALASYLDHVNRWQEGISLLEEHFFSRNEATASTGIRDQWKWALYTRGLLRRRYAEAILARTLRGRSKSVERTLEAARRDFESCHKRSRSPESAGIDHHLGVLDLLEGRYEEACKRFRCSIATLEEHHEQCLAKRKHRVPELLPSIRLGYSYRRLAICYMLLGKADEAKSYFEYARDIAAAHKHHRLLAEIAADVDAWDLEGGFC